MAVIPFVDLKSQYLEAKEDIDKAMQSVINNNAYILGGALDEFEKNFASFCGTKYSVGVASGLDALSLALRALNVSEGDEVITTANTFIATALAVNKVGAKPVFVDCDSSYCMDPNKLESAITDKTKAVIPVHMFGKLADMEKITQITKKHNLYLIEDSAQAHGAEFKGKRAGSFGDIGCFSFYPAKNLGAFGDGGAITTNSEKYSSDIKVIRHYGQRVKNEHELLGVNSRLDTLHAAVLDVKLKLLDNWNDKRRKAADMYREMLCGLPIELPSHESKEHVYHLYIARVENRDDVSKKLAERNVQSGVHYPIPVHLHKAYEYLGYKKGSFSVAEDYADKIISLPMFPHITEEQIETVAKALKDIL